MRTWLRPTLALVALLALLLGAAACSSDDGDDESSDTTAEATDETQGSQSDGDSDDDDEGSDDDGGGGDSSSTVDESCLTDDAEASTASALREYVNCVLTDEPLVGASTSGSPDQPDQSVELSTFEGGDVPVEICEVASPLVFDELALTDAEITVLLLDDAGSGDTAVERVGADGECTPA
jgi:hypothetical protein